MGQDGIEPVNAEVVSVEHILLALNMTWKILFIAFFFGFCIFIHEFGHLVAALWQGLHVERFSLGFGKKLFGFKRFGVEFIVSALPFGGYVALPQLDPTDQPVSTEGKELPPGRPLPRAITAFAGPLFNVLFGFALATVMWLVGVWEPVPARSCIVVEVPPTLPLYKDGLKMEDRIVALNGEPVHGEWEELCFSIPADAPEQTVTVSRNGEAVDLRYTPEPNPEWLAGLRGGDRIVAVNGKSFKRGTEELQMEYVYSDGPQVELTVQDGEESKVISYVPAPNPMMENLGLPFFVARNPVTLGGILPGTPAADAGLQVGDQLLALNGQSVLSARKLLADIEALQGEAFTLLVARQNQEIVLPEMRLAGDVSAQALGLVFAVTVRSVVPDTPAARAGFQPNDRLAAVNGEEVTDSEMFTEIVRASGSKPLDVTVIRDGKERVLSNIQARPVTIDGKEVYQVGLSLVDSVPRIIGHPSPWEQFENVVSTTGRTLKLLFKPLTAKLGGAPAGRAQVKVRHMSGPLGIILMLWYKLKLEGLRGGLSFIILITFSLALINLLPFPVLDGGHILFAGIEGVTRRRMPVKVMLVLQNVFAFLLIALMVYITFFDGSRIFKRLRLFFAEPAPVQTEAPAQPAEDETAPEATLEAAP